MRSDPQGETIDENTDNPKTMCKACNKPFASTHVAHHYNIHHNENDSQEQVVEGNVQAEKQLQPQKILESKRATKEIGTKGLRKKANTLEENSSVPG